MTDNKLDNTTGRVSEAELIELADSGAAGGTTPWVSITVSITTVTLTADACPTSGCTTAC